jgi:hypothetical protein
VMYEYLLGLEHGPALQPHALGAVPGYASVRLPLCAGCSYAPDPVPGRRAMVQCRSGTDEWTCLTGSGTDDGMKPWSWLSSSFHQSTHLITCRTPFFHE